MRDDIFTFLCVLCNILDLTRLWVRCTFTFAYHLNHLLAKLKTRNNARGREREGRMNRAQFMRMTGRIKMNIAVSSRTHCCRLSHPLLASLSFFIFCFVCHDIQIYREAKRKKIYIRSNNNTSLNNVKHTLARWHTHRSGKERMRQEKCQQPRSSGGGGGVASTATGYNVKALCLFCTYF